MIIPVICGLSCSASLPAREEAVNIWEGTPVHKKVMLTPYLAAGSGNACVIVCPGGSYFWHDMQNEGVKVAEWLQSAGISAFVLKYRVAGVPAFIFHTRWVSRGRQYPDARQDLQRSIEYVKNHALELGVDTNRVGAMGFSAGGHLVMSVAETYDSPRTRPAFVAPIYPVVSLSANCVHKRSRRGLLGEYGKHRPLLRDSLSLEKYVPEDCPPVFLVNCVDDPIVDYRNSEILDSALTAKRIPHRYIQYKRGGHGFGASDDKGTPECRAWRQAFIAWLREIKVIGR